MSDHPSSPSARVTDTEPETPNSRVSRDARRGVDRDTSSPGRDLPPFEDESDLLGGVGNYFLAGNQLYELKTNRQG